MSYVYEPRRITITISNSSTGGFSAQELEWSENPLPKIKWVAEPVLGVKSKYGSMLIGGDGLKIYTVFVLQRADKESAWEIFTKYDVITSHKELAKQKAVALSAAEFKDTFNYNDFKVVTSDDVF